jgi:hypothetical protein
MHLANLSNLSGKVANLELVTDILGALPFVDGTTTNANSVIKKILAAEKVRLKRRDSRLHFFLRILPSRKSRRPMRSEINFSLRLRP